MNTTTGKEKEDSNRSRFAHYYQHPPRRTTRRILEDAGDLPPPEPVHDKHEQSVPRISRRTKDEKVHGLQTAVTASAGSTRLGNADEQMRASRQRWKENVEVQKNRQDDNDPSAGYYGTDIDTPNAPYPETTPDRNHEPPTVTTPPSENDEIENLPHAMPVQGQENHREEPTNQVSGSPIAVATKFTTCIDLKSNKIRICFLLVILILCGTIAGVVYAVVSSKSNDTEPSSPPHETPAPGAPTGAPAGSSPATSLFLEQHGQELFPENSGTRTGPRGQRNFGWTVDLSMDGNRLAVSLPYCPCVYIYDLDVDDSTWIQTGTVSGGPGILDHFALSGDGSVIVIGIPGGDDNVDQMGGVVQVFEETVPGSWQRLGQPLYGQSSTDHLGGFADKWKRSEYDDPVLTTQSYDSRTLSLSQNGRTLALGSPRGNYVRVLRYDEDTALWKTLGKDAFLLGEDAADDFGNSVDLTADGTRIIVGSPDNLGNAHPNFHVYNGLVRVFDYSETEDSWKKVGQDLKGSRGEFLHGLQEGSTVSISADGSTIAIGANLAAESEDIWVLGENDGHVRVLSYAASRDEWIQQGNIVNVFQFGLTFDKSDFSLVQMESGLQMEKFPIVTRLSGDGKRFAVCAIAESLDGRLMGRGVVRLYELRGEVWTTIGDPIEGSDDFDSSGRSFALSFDGSRLAIGSPLHNGFGGDQGQVRVFDVQRRTGTGFPQPTLSPTVQPEPTGGQAVPITVVLLFERDVEYSLECGNIVLASASEKSENETSLVDTYLVAPEAACLLSFGEEANAEYKVFYGEDPSNEDHLLIRGAFFYLSQPDVAFVVTEKVVSVSLAVQLDNYPHETGFSLWCNDVLYMRSLPGTAGKVNGYVNTTVNGIREGAVCEFEIVDSFGDGLCCGEAGQGFYEIYFGDNVDNEANLLVFGNGEFGNSDVASFVASTGQALVTSNPSSPAPPTDPPRPLPTQSPLTVNPTTTLVPTVSPMSLVPITVIIDLAKNKPEEVGWRLQCDRQNVAQAPVGFYTVPDSVVTEVLMVEDNAFCRFIISAVKGFFSEFSSVSFSIYYGEDTTDNDMLILAGRKFDFLQIVPFKVSPSENPITPRPTYVTLKPTSTPRPTVTPSVSPAPTSEGDVLIEVMLQLDRYPSDTGWRLVCENTELKDVPVGSFNKANELIQETFAVKAGYLCHATVLDSVGDGLLGGGYFQILLVASQQVLVRVEGQGFKFFGSVSFTVPLVP